MQSSKFISYSRIRKALESSQRVTVFSFFDSLTSWEGAANKLGLGLEFRKKVKFIFAADFLLETDWLGKNSFGRLLDEIEKTATDTDLLILDGLSIVCSLLEENRNAKNQIYQFLQKIADLERCKISICCRPRSLSKLDEFFVRCAAHA